MSPCFFDVKVVPPNKKNKTTIKPIDSLVLKILHWFILKYFKMCSLNQIIKSSVPASLLLAILSSSVSTSWTPPKKVWRSMWCSNDSTDHLGFMWIYVDLCGFMQFIWCCFSRIYAIYGDFFRICLPTNLLAELLMNVNGSTPKKWRYLVSYESQSLPINFSGPSHTQKKHYAVSDWKTPPSNMRF